MKSGINSNDISVEFAEHMGLSKAAGKAYVDEMFKIILKHLMEDQETVTIKNFGKFTMRISAPKKGRNIQSQEVVDIPAKQRISFKMSRTLSDKIEAGEDIYD